MTKFHTRDETSSETSKDEKQHDAADKQQVCISDGSRLRRAKNWTHTPSASDGSYGRQAGRRKTSLF